MAPRSLAPSLYRSILTGLRRTGKAAHKAAAVVGRGQTASDILRRNLRVCLRTVANRAKKNVDLPGDVKGLWSVDCGGFGVQELDFSVMTSEEVKDFSGRTVFWPCLTEASASVMPSSLIVEQREAEGKEGEKEKEEEAEAYGGEREALADFDQRRAAVMRPSRAHVDLRGTHAVVAVKRGFGDCIVHGGQVAFVAWLPAGVTDIDAELSSGKGPLTLPASVRVADLPDDAENWCNAELVFESTSRARLLYGRWGAKKPPATKAPGDPSVDVLELAFGRDIDTTTNADGEFPEVLATVRSLFRSGTFTPADAFLAVRWLTSASTGLSSWAETEPTRLQQIDAALERLPSQMDKWVGAQPIYQDDVPPLIPGQVDPDVKLWTLWRSHGDARVQALLREAMGLTFAEQKRPRRDASDKVQTQQNQDSATSAGGSLTNPAGAGRSLRAVFVTNRLLELDPTCAEGWFMRAMAMYHLACVRSSVTAEKPQELKISVWCSAMALCYEPRHFVALCSVAQVHKDIRADAAAAFSAYKLLKTMFPEDSEIAGEIAALTRALCSTPHEGEIAQEVDEEENGGVGKGEKLTATPVLGVESAQEESDKRTTSNA
eukprot:Hpha_TRINITY_DN16771_c1_g8::TRINITY_DN16771_c1_g8_i1::g.75994::m.75994